MVISWPTEICKYKVVACPMRSPNTLGSVFLFFTHWKVESLTNWSRIWLINNCGQHKVRNVSTDWERTGGFFFFTWVTYLWVGFQRPRLL